jgi:hypothetical protein
VYVVPEPVTRADLNRFIDCPVRFLANRLKNFFPSEWHREHEIVYVKADPMKVSERVPGGVAIWGLSAMGAEAFLQKSANTPNVREHLPAFAHLYENSDCGHCCCPVSGRTNRSCGS